VKRILSLLIAATLSNVVATTAAAAQTPEAGRQVFSARCATCHGTEGTGGEFGPSIVARIPLRNDQELDALIREGLPGAGMPAFQSRDSLSRDERRAAFDDRFVEKSFSQRRR